MRARVEANVVRENEEDGGGSEVLARHAARNRKYRMNKKTKTGLQRVKRTTKTKTKVEGVLQPKTMKTM